MIAPSSWIIRRYGYCWLVLYCSTCNLVSGGDSWRYSIVSSLFLILFSFLIFFILALVFFFFYGVFVSATGHVLFEMCTGYELYAPKPTPRHLEDMKSYPQVNWPSWMDIDLAILNQLGSVRLGYDHQAKPSVVCAYHTGSSSWMSSVWKCHQTVQTNKQTIIFTGDVERNLGHGFC